MNRPDFEKPWLIFSPVGTSLLSNSVEQNIYGLVRKNANHAKADVPPEEREELEAHLAARRKHLLSLEPDEASVMSAEIAGIVRLYSEENRNFISKKQSIPDDHYLLCTDTWLGRETGKMVQEWLMHMGQNVQPLPGFSGLQTADIEEFNAALPDMVKWIYEYITPLRNRFRIIFNLTGGYKIIQGCLQTIAMFVADESVYLFETAGQLIHIPKLPVALDFESIIVKNSTQFRKMEIGMDVTRRECAGIPDSMYMNIDGGLTLSAWGELGFSEVKGKLFSEKILEPLSDNISYSRNFLKKAEKIPPDRKLILNQQMDKLAVFISTGDPSRNTPKLSFKKLAGNPCPPSTLECYAWSDKDARRVFCHFEGNTLMIDNLGKHL